MQAHRYGAMLGMVEAGKLPDLLIGAAHQPEVGRGAGLDGQLPIAWRDRRHPLLTDDRPTSIMSPQTEIAAPEIVLARSLARFGILVGDLARVDVMADRGI